MDEKHILQQLNKIKDIPTLPTIVFELNKHLENPETSIAKVSETIEKDQAMALRILKLVNSAFYGFKSRVSDIKNAVVLLGFNAVRNAIVSVSIINALPKSLLFQDFEMNEFWKHSLAVAVASKNIAQKAGLESPDNCFVGGLLHDVGKVILAQYFQDLFVKVWIRMQKECVTFYQAELHELPIDHARIGAHLAERWALPQGLIDGLRWHHEFQPDNPNANFVMIIHLANILVNSYDENPDCEIDMTALHPEAVKFLMEQMEDSADWYSSLTGEIEAAYDLFLDADF
ncbi:MAG: HDOD domain-containing protein [Desulfobacterales bacterium]|nr:MAG: HDOD domain-containing protein [Desulfobacterales bacterium]